MIIFNWSLKDMRVVIADLLIKDLEYKSLKEYSVLTRLNGGDTKTRQNIDEYLDENYTKDGIKKTTKRPAQDVREYKERLIEWSKIVERTGVPSEFLEKVKGIHLLGRRIIVKKGKGEEMRRGYDRQKAKEFIKTYRIN